MKTSALIWCHSIKNAQTLSTRERTKVASSLSILLQLVSESMIALKFKILCRPYWLIIWSQITSVERCKVTSAITVRERWMSLSASATKFSSKSKVARCLSTSKRGWCEQKPSSKSSTTCLSEELTTSTTRGSWQTCKDYYRFSQTLLIWRRKLTLWLQRAEELRKCKWGIKLISCLR